MRYDVLTQEAMRQVVRNALIRVAEEGRLPGNHHFYIAFRTDLPEVKLADELRERHPEEITIVLQHRFWNLEVHEDAFEVELTFNNVPQHLYIPFSAIRAFYDPSVEFGLQFHVEPDASPTSEPLQAAPAIIAPEISKTATAPDDAPEVEETEHPEDTAQEAEVVQLDAFRKK